MTTLGRREKCHRNLSERGHLPALCCPPEAKPALPASLETQWTKTVLNLAEGGCPV
jgi:hypothetical protein